MKRYHCLGFLVKNGRCKVACYDVVKNKVEVIPSLDWNAIKDELCTSLEAESLVASWKDNAEFAWSDLSKLSRVAELRRIDD